MKVSVGVSNRHIHMNDSDFKLLFGDIDLPIRNYVNQPGQFASTLTVTLKGPKGKIENVRVVGPKRNYTQVEISKTDARVLGLNPPIRDSGDLRDASSITIENGSVSIERPCCIIANRHIHVDSKIREEYGLEDVNEVSVRVSGLKSGILEHVYLKDSDKAYFEMHIDTDDANAFLIKNNDEVEIIL
jgi:putative phosphotransacetylase